MDTNKVFTTFNKNGCEILLFLESMNNYLDLINNKLLKKEDIELQTLVKYRKTIKTLKYLPKNLIKQLYIFDRTSMINSENIYLGIQCTVSNYNERIKFDYTYYTERTWDIVDKKKGLYVYCKSAHYKDINYNIFKNIINQKDYIQSYNISRLPKFGDGTKYVLINGVNLNDVIKEKYITKKKVYEYANCINKLDEGVIV